MKRHFRGSMWRGWVRLIVLILQLSSVNAVHANQQLDDVPAQTVQLFIQADDHTSEVADFLIEHIHRMAAVHGITVEMVSEAAPGVISLEINTQATPAPEPPTYQVAVRWHGHSDTVRIADQLPFIHTDRPFEVTLDRDGFQTAPESQKLLDFVLGLALYTSDRCPDAALYFQRILNVDNTAANAALTAFYLGNCAALNEDHASAIDHYLAALIVYDAQVLHPPALMNLLWFMETRPDAAHDITVEYKEYLWDQLDFVLGGRDDPVLFDARARLYLLVNRFDDARRDADTAIMLDSENPEYYTLRGQINLALYEWDASLTDYNQALAVDPDHTEAYFYRGVLHYSILQTGVATREEALADFEAYLAHAPEGVHAEAAATYADSIRAAMDALNQ